MPTPFKVYRGKGVMPILPYQILTKRLIFNIIRFKMVICISYFHGCQVKSLLRNAIQLMQYVIS